MFDYSRFYNGLFNRIDLFDNYWDKFPKGQQKLYKTENLNLLKRNIEERDAVGLSHIIAIIIHDGADSDFTHLLLPLLNESWHTAVEDIISVLEIIKDPNSVNDLYIRTINVPEYDDMRAIAKKCMWALFEINTTESKDKLILLSKIDDEIISENADFHLKNFDKR